MSGELQPEEIQEMNDLMKEIEGVNAPPIPDYLQAKPLASAIRRGLSHSEHKAEWEAKHGPIPKSNVKLSGSRPETTDLHNQ